MKPDRVEEILRQWRTQRPEVDVSPMKIVGRVKRLARLFEQATSRNFGKHGLEPWEFDVLASLLRSGPPHRLSAGELGRAMMITSGSVTHRIDGLEAREWVRRVEDPDDRRGVLIELCPKGIRAVDSVLSHHVETERQLLMTLTTARQGQLADLLRLLLVALEGD